MVFSIINAIGIGSIQQKSRLRLYVRHYQTSPYSAPTPDSVPPQLLIDTTDQQNTEHFFQFRMIG